MFAAEHSPHEPPQARDLLAVITDMVPEAAEELAYDEPANDDIRQLDVGLIWDVDRKQLRAGESARICLCNEEGRYNLGALLQKQHGIEVLPLAFVELKSEQPGASFTSMMYVLENNEVKALLDTSIEDEDILSEDSEDCFDFAERLGFGAQWTKAMFRAAEDGDDTRTSQLVDLSDEQKVRFHTFLNSLADRV